MESTLNIWKRNQSWDAKGQSVVELDNHVALGFGIDLTKCLSEGPVTFNGIRRHVRILIRNQYWYSPCTDSKS